MNHNEIAQPNGVDAFPIKAAMYSGRVHNWEEVPKRFICKATSISSKHFQPNLQSCTILVTSALVYACWWPCRQQSNLEAIPAAIWYSSGYART